MFDDYTNNSDQTSALFDLDSYQASITAVTQSINKTFTFTTPPQPSSSSHNYSTHSGKSSRSNTSIAIKSTAHFTSTMMPITLPSIEDSIELQRLKTRLKKFLNHSSDNTTNNTTNTSHTTNTLLPESVNWLSSPSGLGANRSNRLIDIDSETKHPTHGEMISSSTNSKDNSHELRVCFNQVPSVYFKPDFSLPESEVFQQLETAATATTTKSPPQTNTRSPTPTTTNTTTNTTNNNTRATTATTTTAAAATIAPNHSENKTLQDKLSMYLDTVELALLKQIWSRSPDFFRSLANITTLSLDVEDTCRTINKVRLKIRRMDSEVALTAMRIPLLYIRHNNQQALQRVLLSIQQVRTSQVLVQELLGVDDFVGVLQLCRETLLVTDTELRGVQCISSVRRALSTVQRQVGDRLVNRFVDLALDWHLQSGDEPTSTPSPTLSPTTPKPSPYGGSDSTSESDHTMENTVSALLSSSLLDRALVEYKNKLCDNVRLIVRTCVAEYMGSFDPLTWAQDLGDKLFEDGAGGGDETPFANRVRGMSNEDFLSALSFCVENLALSLQRTAAVNKVLSTRFSMYTSSSGAGVNGGVLKDGGGGNVHPTLSPLSLELSEQCVEAACDLGQRSLSQV